MSQTVHTSQTQHADYNGWSLDATCSEFRESGRALMYVARCVATRRPAGDLGALPGPTEIVAATSELTAGGYETPAEALETAIYRARTKIDEALL